MKKKQFTTIKAEDLIEITSRLCSENLQPAIKEGQRYFVKEVTELGDGTPVLVVSNPNKKGKVIRINARRFTFKKTSFERIAYEQNVVKWKAEERQFNKMLAEKMSSAEAISVVYVPHVVETMAVSSLLKCHKFCGEHKFSEYRDIMKAVTDLEKSNYYAQINEIKFEVYKLIEQAVDMFSKEFAEEIDNLWHAIRRELNRAYPHTLPEGKIKDGMRTDAIFGLALLEILKRCYLDHDSVVTAGVGEILYDENKRIGDIRKYLNVYAGNIEKVEFKNFEKEVATLKHAFTNIKFDTDVQEEKRQGEVVCNR